METKNEILNQMLDTLNEIEFEHGIDHFTCVASRLNPFRVQAFIDNNDDGSKLFKDLREQLAKFNALGSSITKKEVRIVFDLLKARVLHPRGKFDKAGRFHLEDSELVDVRAPSVRYPYTQVSAGRTRKFIEAVANKYKCSTLDELTANFKCLRVR